MPNVHELIRDHVTLSIRCLDHSTLDPVTPRSAKFTRKPFLQRDKLASFVTIGRATDRVSLWTHYYDPKVCGAVGSAAFLCGHRSGIPGVQYTLYRQQYSHRRWNNRFFGGGATFSSWHTRSNIVGALRHFGFQHIETAFEESDHRAGPAFSVVGSKSPAAEGLKNS